MAEIYREGCMDMDHPRQDVQADALREETRKLQRYMEEQFTKQENMLSELKTHLRFMIRDEAALRLATFPDEINMDVPAETDAPVEGNDQNSNQEEPPSWDPCWDPEMRSKLKEHQQKAKTIARMTSSLSNAQLEVINHEWMIRRWAFGLASSATFQACIMLLILLNLVMLGVEVDVASSLGPEEEDPVIFQVLNITIVVVFIFEIVVKIMGFGFNHFFYGPERWWNAFDLVIITTSVIETFLDLLTKTMESSTVDSSHLRIMRFMRLARALRGVRVMRLVRFIGALRSIVFAIMSTLWSLVWTLVLLVLLFYCFAVILAQLVSDHCRFSSHCDAMLQRHWASVPESMLTLFLSITGGLSWTEALEPLRTVSGVAFSCLIVYVFLSYFAILNVVTGVFCNNAIESSKADKDIAIMKQMEWHKGQLRALKGVFNEIDNDKSNKVSIKELEVAMSQEKLASFMESMDISTQDIWTLFLILDADGSGEISFEEFVSGCMQLQGPAQSVQLARMRYENKVMRQELRRVGIALQKLESLVALNQRVDA